MNNLARSYRLLLLAYPRWYRREHGLELLTTLLDHATPGQRRPRLVDVASLIGAGLRARLLPPRTPIAWAVNAVVTCSAGLAAAAVAVLLSPYPGPPAEEQAIAVATIAVGPVTRNVPGPPVACLDGGCPWFGVTDQVVPEDAAPMRIDYTMVYYDLPIQETFGITTSARERLTTAGWQVDPAPPPGDIAGVTASNDQFKVHISGHDFLDHHGRVFSTITVFVTKQISPAIIVNVFTAGLCGLIAGWPLGVWGIHRFQRHQARRRRIILAAAIPFLTTASLVILLTGMLAAVDFSSGIDPPDVQAPLAFAGMSLPTKVFSTLCVLLGLTALGLTVAPGTRDTSTGNSPHPIHQARA